MLYDVLPCYYFTIVVTAVASSSLGHIYSFELLNGNNMQKGRVISDFVLDVYSF